MGMFGPSKKEVWKQLSQEIGAKYIEGSFLKGSRESINTIVGLYIWIPILSLQVKVV